MLQKHSTYSRLLHITALVHMTRKKGQIIWRDLSCNLCSCIFVALSLVNGIDILYALFEISFYCLKTFNKQKSFLNFDYCNETCFADCLHCGVSHWIDIQLLLYEDYLSETNISCYERYYILYFSVHWDILSSKPSLGVRILLLTVLRVQQIVCRSSPLQTKLVLAVIL